MSRDLHSLQCKFTFITVSISFTQCRGSCILFVCQCPNSCAANWAHYHRHLCVSKKNSSITLLFSFVILNCIQTLLLLLMEMSAANNNQQSNELTTSNNHEICEKLKKNSQWWIVQPNKKQSITESIDPASVLYLNRSLAALIAANASSFEASTATPSDALIAASSGLKNGFTFFSSPSVLGMVDCPAALLASTSVFLRCKFSLSASIQTANRALLWVYSWAQ